MMVATQVGIYRVVGPRRGVAGLSGTTRNSIFDLPFFHLRATGSNFVHSHFLPDKLGFYGE